MIRLLLPLGLVALSIAVRALLHRRRKPTVAQQQLARVLEFPDPAKRVPFRSRRSNL